MATTARPSLCLYTNLFTLADREVKDNKYVDMFFIWLAQLLHLDILKRDDQLVIVTDQRTATWLEVKSDFSTYRDTFKCPVSFYTTAPPRTLFEGCCNKYVEIPFTQNCIMYTDIDVLFLKPVDDLLAQTQDETIYCQPEGDIHNEDYSADFNVEEMTLFQEDCGGLSAGKFLIRGQGVYNKYIKLMKSILSAQLPQWERYYTLEQPLFNRCMFTLMFQREVEMNTTLLFPPRISANWLEYEHKKTVLMDLCGQPGDAALHLSKMLQAVLLLHAKIDLSLLHIA